MIRISLGGNAIKGMDALQPALDRAAAATVRQGVALLHRKLSVYPAQLPPKRAKYKPYKRTGTLGRRWTSKVDGQVGRIGNTTRYARYVQGSRKQRPGQTREMQRRGWPSVDAVLEAARPELQRIYREAVAGALRDITR